MNQSIIQKYYSKSKQLILPARMTTPLEQIDCSKIKQRHQALIASLQSKLEWSRVDKGLLALLLLVPSFIMYVCWDLYVLSRPDRAHLVNLDMLSYFNQFQIVIAVIAGFILLLGLILHRRNPNHPAYQYIALQFLAIALVGMSYSIGTMSFVGGLVLLAAPIWGLILLDPKAVWWATGTSLIMSLGLSYATAFGLLPYSPLVIPPTDHTSNLFWMNSIIFFSAPFFIILLGMSAQMLAWWRDREDKIRQLSLTDALTRIHNRLSILDFLDHEVARAKRLGTALSVVILDLDHFKRVNDEWGHPTGDIVLQETAQLLKHNIRAMDSVGRYGGEEFIIVLPGADQTEAFNVLERCRTQLAQLNIVTDDDQIIHVTASFGLVSLANRLQNQRVEPHTLIKFADQALYTAKHAGRNRIESVIMTESIDMITTTA